MFAKLFELILLNQVNEFIQKKNLNGTLLGFQKQKSSTDAVLHLTEALQENYDNLKISAAVFSSNFELKHVIQYRTNIFSKRLKCTVYKKVQLIYLLHFSKTDSIVLR